MFEMREKLLVTPEVLRKVVQNDTGRVVESVEVVSVENACGSGENFVSSLLRVGVRYESYTTTYIFKVLDRESRFRNFADLDELFDKEAFMYETVLPRVQEILRDAGEDDQLAPRCFGVFQGAQKMLVLEDLKEGGFSTRQKQNGLSLAEVKAVLRKIAKFHAASVVYQEQFGYFHEKYFSDWRRAQYDTFYGSFVEAVESWEGFEEEARVIQTWKEDILRQGGAAFTQEADPALKVICHGDFWINNVLFKDLEPRLVDFQFSCSASPALDLLFFLAYSLSEDDRVAEFDNMLSFYFEELERSLSRLNQKTPSRETFLEDVRRRMFGCSFLLVFHLTTLLLDEHSKLDMARALESPEYRRQMYENPRYKRAAQKFLKYLGNRRALGPKIN